MTTLGNLFNPFFHRKKMSEATIERLRRYRGKETAEWLAKQDEQAVINAVMAHGGELPLLDEPPKLEDVDKHEKDDSPIYIPPVETTYISLGTAVSNNDRRILQADNKQVDWIEQLFREFLRCANQFNSTNRTPALKVSVSLPEYKFERSPYDTYLPEAKISIFKGRISTLHWGFLVQGYSSDIEIYAVPSSELLTLTINDIRGKGYNPFLVINSELVNGEVKWLLENEPVSASKLPLLAKEIFGDLIRISAGQMKDSELFANYSQELKVGETVAQGYSADSDADSSLCEMLAGLSTWHQCHQLTQVVESDLRTLLKQEEAATGSGNSTQLQQLKEASADLRAVLSAVSTIADKYTNPADCETSGLAK